MNGVTTTAQIVGSMSGLDLNQLISYGIAALLGLLLAPGHQAIIEGLLSKFPLPFWMKAFVPTVLASLIGSIAAWALKNYGVTPGDAIAAAASLSGFTHLVNGTKLAADMDKLTADLPARTTGAAPKSAFAFLLVAFLGLGAGHAHASSLSLGPISISPTASAPVVIVQPFLVAETWAVAGGGELGLRNDKIGGIQAGPEWGPYGVGVALGIDEDTVAGVTYLTAGGYGEFMPWGEALILARNGGATFSLTIPWELGGSVTN